MRAQQAMMCILVSSILWNLPGCTAGENPPPSGTVEIESSWPADGAVGVDADIALQVVFSVPMEKQATEAAFSIDPPVPGSFSWSLSKAQMTFTPSVSLAHDTVFLCTVSDAARSDEGAVMEAEYAFSFTTGLSEDTNAWSGNRDVCINGAALAVDSDSDGNADSLVSPASIPISPLEVPAGSVLVQAFLYWGGSQGEGTGADQTITLGLPDGASTNVTADEVFFNDAGSASYDIYVCKKDITWDICSRTADFTGTYQISGYSGLAAGGAADNASAAILFVYEPVAAQNRAVRLVDTLSRMSSNTYAPSFSGLNALEPPSGKIAYYTLEGDVGGTGTEQVMLQGLPGGLSLSLSDPNNPVNNPMNRTITTVTPAATNTVGVDIDVYDMSACLTGHDTSLSITYSAGTDTWWHVLTVASIEVY